MNKSKLYKWVMETFDVDGTTASVNGTSSFGNTPFGGFDKMSGTPVNQNSEDLKKKMGGVSKVKDLKQVVDNYLRDIKTAVEDCLTDEATDSSYSKLLDLMQKPEVLAKIEHIREELSLAKQNQGLETNRPVN